MSSPIWASTSGCGSPGLFPRRPPGGWSGWHRGWTRPPSGPALLLVGDGPYRAALGRLAGRLRVADSVVFTGPVSWADLPAYYDAADVFAMPCRTRRRGLDVEGLGIVYLEASATGLPVIGGDSGGAPDAIAPGESGYVVPGGDVAAVAGRLIQLLGDPAAANPGWLAVQRLDIGGEVLDHDVPADLERRSEVPGLLGEVGTEDPEPPD